MIIPNLMCFSSIKMGFTNQYFLLTQAERCKVEELEQQVAAKNDSLQRNADILKVNYQFIII